MGAGLTRSFTLLRLCNIVKFESQAKCVGGGVWGEWVCVRENERKGENQLSNYCSPWMLLCRVIWIARQPCSRQQVL